MELPDSLLDVGKAYVNDIQTLLPTTGLLICCLALALSITANVDPNFDAGIWIQAASTPIATFDEEGKQLWGLLSVASLPIAILCASAAVLTSRIFRRIVFWAITSTSEFKKVQANQQVRRGPRPDSHAEQIAWVKSQAQKTIQRVKRKEQLAELLCGVALCTVAFGSIISSTLDLSVFLGSLAIAYVFVQSAAKEYIANAFPYILLTANMIGFFDTGMDAD